MNVEKVMKCIKLGIAFLAIMPYDKDATQTEHCILLVKGGLILLQVGRFVWQQTELCVFRTWFRLGLHTFLLHKMGGYTNESNNDERANSIFENCD